MDVKQAITAIIASGKAAPTVNKPVDSLVPGEILTERTANAKVFPGPDGKRIARVYGIPIHFRDTDGLFKAIDTTIKRKPLADPLQTHKYEVKSGTYHAHFKADKPHDYRLEVGTSWVEYEALFMESSSLSISVEPSKIGVKETITLLDDKAPTKLDWKFTRSDGWDYSIVLPTPTAIDALGKRVPIVIDMAAGDIHIVLDTSKVVFPITLDPSSIIATNDGNVYTSDSTYALARDAEVGSAKDTTLTEVGIYVDGPFDVTRSFFSFLIPDMQSISAGSLFLEGKQDISTVDFEIYLHTSTYSSPLSTADFPLFSGRRTGQAHNGTVLNDVWNSSSYSATWNEIVLNAAGRAAVLAAKNSTLKLAAISKNDYDNAAPAGNPEYQLLRFESSVTAGKEPYLSITYVPPQAAPPIFMNHYRQLRG